MKLINFLKTICFALFTKGLIKALSYQQLMQLGSWCANHLIQFKGKRYQIITHNIQHCFPELSVAEQNKLSQQAARLCCQAILIEWYSWHYGNQAMAKIDIQGLNILEQAKATGRPIVLVVPHINLISITDFVLMCHCKLSIAYMMTKNPLLDRYITKCRLPTKWLMPGCGFISVNQPRKLVQHLKGGGALIFHPDVDRREHSGCFVDFLGQKRAATLFAAKMIQKTNAITLFCHTQPLKDARNSKEYQLTISRPFDQCFGSDVIENTQMIYSEIEEMVRSNPHNYWWVHRMFKTQPEGATKSIYE